MFLGQKVAFWGGVAVVSLIAQFALEAVNSRFPSVGLSRFTAYAHKGASA